MYYGVTHNCSIFNILCLFFINLTYLPCLSAIHVSDTTAKEGSVATTTKTVTADDSSPKPHLHKKNTKGTDTRKNPASPRVALTLKTRPGKKMINSKAAKMNAARKLASNESANSSPDGETRKVILTSVYYS